uniref:Uncharacterized protein n=1 Tax=Anguilla anguilla TaxID=7936 RepID=A0A0E9TFW5_ANGAN
MGVTNSHAKAISGLQFVIICLHDSGFPTRCFTC